MSCRFMYLSIIAQLALCITGVHILGSNQPQIDSIWEILFCTEQLFIFFFYCYYSLTNIHNNYLYNIIILLAVMSNIMI